MNTWYVHKFPDQGTKSNVWDWYVLNMPTYGDPGFYRQTVSFNCFFHGYNKRVGAAINKYGVWDPRVKKLLHNHTPDGHIFAARSDHEYNIEKGIFAKGGARLDRYEPLGVFNSIWEFYEFVGYDYKTKKWKK